MSLKFYINLFAQVVLCFGLTLFCFLILLDGIADYRTWRPIIFVLQFVLLPIWLIITHRQAFLSKLNWRKSVGTVLAILSSDLIILLMGAFSFVIWLDLSDGKTEILLP